jgi:hypothetical protein
MPEETTASHRAEPANDRIDAAGSAGVLSCDRPGALLALQQELGVAMAGPKDRLDDAVVMSSGSGDSTGNPGTA